MSLIRMVTAERTSVTSNGPRHNLANFADVPTGIAGTRSHTRDPTGNDTGVARRSCRAA